MISSREIASSIDVIGFPEEPVAVNYFREKAPSQMVDRVLNMTYIYKYLRSSHWRCYVRKGVLRDFAKFTVKNLFQSLFFNKVAGLNLQLY